MDTAENTCAGLLEEVGRERREGDGRVANGYHYAGREEDKRLGKMRRDEDGRVEWSLYHKE
jgi:hypothetical protein